MNIDISVEDSNYMYDFIQKIIDEAGCRIPGSPQEAKGAELIKKEMEETCEEVTIEPFKLHPRAFLGWIRIDILLVVLSLGFFFLISILPEMMLILAAIALGLNILAFLIINNEFFNYKEFIDPLFKERESQNVVGKIKAQGELKKIIIFSGHHDSALQFNLLRYLKFGYPIVLFLGLGILFFWILFSAFFFVLVLFNIANYVWFLEIVTFVLLIGIVPLIALFFFVSSGEKANKVPGAVDNLSAVAVALAVGRYLKNHKEIIPPNTEIRLISFGSEEAGLRGAYRYAEAHKKELLEHDAYVVNMDGIMSTKNPLIVEFEPTTRTAHSKELVDKLVEASKVVGVNAKAFGSSFLEKLAGQISGGTDAAAFSKAGIKAASIASMELSFFIKAYHTPRDTLDRIQRSSLEEALKICLGFLLIESN